MITAFIFGLCLYLTSINVFNAIYAGIHISKGNDLSKSHDTHATILVILMCLSWTIYYYLTHSITI